MDIRQQSPMPVLLFTLATDYREWWNILRPELHGFRDWLGVAPADRRESPAPSYGSSSNARAVVVTQYLNPALLIARHRVSRFVPRPRFAEVRECERAGCAVNEVFPFRERRKAIMRLGMPH